MQEVKTVIEAIANECGLRVRQYRTVHGGDVNQSYCLETSEQRFFLKLNDAHQFPGIFACEEDGLMTLHKYSTLNVPVVIQRGTTNEFQWLLLEWLDTAASGASLQSFGAGIADMHRHSAEYFGWTSSNYIGSLVQTNTPAADWSGFYSQYRILPLVQQAFDKQLFTQADVRNAEAFCRDLPNLLPDEPPALLHGDLWSGNYTISVSGRAAIFDPAVYYGHREMDLAMTKLFGGFDRTFYAGYQEQYPLEKNWEHRLQVTQLYPLLVHAVLFGGHYVQQTKEMVRQWGRFA